MIGEEWAEEVEEIRSFEEEPDDNDVIAFAVFLPQGAPRSRCINPSCDSRKMDIFAIMADGIGDDIWFWPEDGESISIVYEWCPSCSLIFASNQY